MYHVQFIDNVFVFFASFFFFFFFLALCSPQQHVPREEDSLGHAQVTGADQMLCLDGQE